MTMRENILVAAAAAFLFGALGSGVAYADEAAFSNQLFFRGAYSSLVNDRGEEVFTDTLTGENDDKSGWSIAAGLDLSAMKIEDLGGANLMGEVFIEYSEFADARVAQATSALLGGTAKSDVSVSELNVTIAPKARFDDLGNGRIRPFIIPIGLSFLVNSPPSDDTSYLGVGLHFGGGIDVLVIDRISVGTDFRYTHGFKQTNTHMTYWTTGAYAALNF